MPVQLEVWRGKIIRVDVMVAKDRREFFEV